MKLIEETKISRLLKAIDPSIHYLHQFCYIIFDHVSGVCGVSGAKIKFGYL